MNVFKYIFSPGLGTISLALCELFTADHHPSPWFSEAYVHIKDVITFLAGGVANVCYHILLHTFFTKMALKKTVKSTEVALRTFRSETCSLAFCCWECVLYVCDHSWNFSQVLEGSMNIGSHHEHLPLGGPMG